MPHPEEEEQKNEFLKRCIPVVISDGTAKDVPQAGAICISIWNRAKGLSEKLKKE